MARKRSGPWSIGSLTGKFKKMFQKTDQFSWYVPQGTVKDGNVGAVLQAAQEGKHDSIDLSKVSEVSGRGLAKLKEMDGLRALKLCDAKVNDNDLQSLAGLKELEWLDLSGVHMNGACFTKMGPLPALQYLNASRTSFCDGAVSSLRQHAQLAVLDLSQTEVTTAAVEVLKQIPTLRVCRLKGSKVDVAILASIAKSEVQWDL